ncbi:MAG: hypothetical protein GY804_05355 [Alphaproteobacteria bacterium]|nr:hypothetical protein [Alphaproteobacteria bacterium]
MKRIATLFMVLLISGCSVGMAMSGKTAPNLGAIKVGATRGEVQLHLGAPTKSNTLDNGTRVDVYEYEIGNEPSAGRAIGHAAMDVLTFGGWELIGTPIEGFQGEKYQATVSFDKNDKVINIFSSKTESAM